MKKILISFVLLLCFISSDAQFEKVYPQEFITRISDVFFHDSGLAIALLECDGIMRSTDNGDTWTYIEVPGMSGQIYCEFIDNDPNRLLITGSYSAYQSENGGLSLEPFDLSGIPTEGLRRFIVQLDNGDYLFIARTVSAISSDLETWSQLPDLPGFHFESEGSKLFLGSGKKLYRSLNNGENNELMHEFDSNIGGISYKNGFLLVSLLGNTVFTSVNDGDSFNQILSPTSGNSNPYIFDNQHYIFINNNRAAITKDGGLNYETVPYDDNLVAGFRNFGIRNDGKVYIVGESLKMYSSADKGMTWQKDSGENEEFTCISVIENKVAIGGNDGSIIFSNDEGKNWSKIGGDRNYIRTIQALENNSIYYVDNAKIGHLIDQEGSEQHSFTFQIHARKQYYNNGVMYLVLNSDDGIVQKSEDNGENWTLMNQFNANVVSMDFVSETTYIVCTFDGKVHISEDAGITWSILHEFEYSIKHASFKSKTEGTWLSTSKLYATNDGFATIEEGSHPYNGLRLIRNDNNLYCFGANGSATFIYKFTGLISNGGVSNGCFAHGVAAAYSDGIIIAGKGNVVERLAENTTGTNSFKNNYEIVIFPNPVHQTLFIENAAAFTSIIITNSIGEVIYNHRSNSEIDLSTLPRGSYFINGISENKIYSGKFIKM